MSPQSSFLGAKPLFYSNSAKSLNYQGNTHDGSWKPLYFQWFLGSVIFFYILLISHKVRIASKTRNQFVGNHTWVRIPPAPPEKAECESARLFQRNKSLAGFVKLPWAVKYCFAMWNMLRHIGTCFILFHFTWFDSIKFHNLRSKLFHRDHKRAISLKPTKGRGTVLYPAN